jgi:hypothetical protein
VNRAAALGLGALRLAIAATVMFVVAYVLSWQILWGGMAGAEAPFHLHLIDWVATTFPNLPWWYQWDGMGVSYREAYPLASHWLAVAASHAFSTNLEGGAQAVQFALMPLTALGLYALFDWRLKLPVAGMVAGIFFMLSPLPWVEWTHFGLYASWVGMPILMPAVIALDTFFFAWLEGDRGWRFRAGAAGFVVLTTLLGMVSPHLLGAPLLVVLGYTLAIPRASAQRAWRWILGVAPALWIAVALLSMFWLGGEIQYLSVVRSHWAGAGTAFDIDRLWPIALSDLLSLNALKTQDLQSLYALSPAVLLPALLGAASAVWNGRARVLLSLAIVSIVMMAFRDLYRPFFVVPGFAEFAVVAHRPFQLLASVTVPALAAVGLYEVPRRILRIVAARPISVSGSRSIAMPAVALMVGLVLVADVVVFASRVQGGGSQLAYGPSLATPSWAPDLRDLWERHTNLPLARQLLDPSQWRAPGIGCDLNCPGQNEYLAKLGATFSSPPARAELNSNAAELDMAFHRLVGGGITHSYNDQVIPSRELASWLEQSMLVDPGTATKRQLADALGVDAVVLSKTQAALAPAYTDMGWVQVSNDPLAFVNPRPSGLAAQWPAGTSVLVVGKTQASVPALYNFVFERATAGVLPFSSAWLVRGTSPKIDDYSDAELSRYSGIVLLGYQYTDQSTAWSRLDRYVRGGGNLFVETGWQYVDPDWNMGSAPPALPVPSVRWGNLDPTAAVVVEGSVDSQFGRFVYGSGGWGASSAGALRPGATELVKAGDRVVAARWQLGKGRVVWSGMNLLAHDASSGSTNENQFVASQFAWLFAPAVGAMPQVPIPPVWDGGDQVSLSLQQSSGPSLVLLKESLFPGWSARLVTPSGTQQVQLVGSEMDFMLATLGPVPSGSKLVFTYGPTALEIGSWWVSLGVLLAIIVWVARPALYSRFGRWIGRKAGRMSGPLARRADSWGDEP